MAELELLEQAILANSMTEVECRSSISKYNVIMIIVVIMMTLVLVAIMIIRQVTLSKHLFCSWNTQLLKLAGGWVAGWVSWISKTAFGGRLVP